MAYPFNYGNMIVFGMTRGAALAEPNGSGPGFPEDFYDACAARADKKTEDRAKQYA